MNCHLFFVINNYYIDIVSHEKLVSKRNDIKLLIWTKLLNVDTYALTFFSVTFKLYVLYLTSERQLYFLFPLNILNIINNFRWTKLLDSHKTD